MAPHSRTAAAFQLVWRGLGRGLGFGGLRPDKNFFWTKLNSTLCDFISKKQIFVYKRHVVRLKTTRSLSVRNGSERVNKRETFGESCSTFHSEIFARFLEKRSQQFPKTAPSLLFKYGLSSSHFFKFFTSNNSENPLA